GGLQVRQKPDVIVQDRRTVEGVDAAGALEHEDARVEVKDLEVRNLPVLVVAAVEKEHPLEIDLGQVPRSLNAGRAETGRGDRDSVDSGGDQEAEVVVGAHDAVVAQSPTRLRIGFPPIKCAAQGDLLAVLEQIDDVDQPAVVVVRGGEGGGL